MRIQSLVLYSVAPVRDPLAKVRNESVHSLALLGVAASWRSMGNKVAQWADEGDEIQKKPDDCLLAIWQPAQEMHLRCEGQ